MTRTLVSIVVPSYNHRRYVGAAVESALAQTHPELEIVVIDDGSSDGSPELLRDFAADPRVRLFEQANQGAHAAIARGLAMARGEYVCILNSDDLFPPVRVERLVAELERLPDKAAASSWIEIIDADGSTIGEKRAWRNLPPWPQPAPGPSLSDLDQPDLALLAGNFVATTSNLLWRRHALPDVELLPLRYCHDWDLALALAQRGLAIVEEPLVRYRVHPANTLREGTDAAEGQAQMRYEALWVVARHAPAVLAHAAARGLDLAELGARFRRSAPEFGCPEIVHVLLAASRFGREAAYRALLETSHPFRVGALARLAEVARLTESASRR